MASESETIAANDNEYVDWRGRSTDPAKHGGTRAAAVVCVVEILENMVFLCNATNFVAYFQKSMHYPSALAANMVTNFMGTSFLLTILGGFISDSFFTRFTTFIFSCAVEILGLVVLTLQAQFPKLQPPARERPSPSQGAILYAGLYAMAIGVGGIKASLPAHGADQLNHNNQQIISAFFNWFFFSMCMGGLLSATVMVWIEENQGWNLSFKISVITLSLALCVFSGCFRLYRHKRPRGSPFSRIFKVFSSAISNRKYAVDEVQKHITSIEENADKVGGRSCGKLRFLNKALIDKNIIPAEVEETRIFFGLLPIFASTIMMNCCLAQLQTFSVQQGHAMDKRIHNFEIPTQSLSVFPLIIIFGSIILYEHSVHILSKKNFGISKAFQPLNRIGLGLALASCSMAVAAAIEAKRRAAAEHDVILSVFWLGWQFLLLGVSDMLTLGGMLEFFYSEAPANMRSMCTALSWCSTSLGYFTSSALVSLTNILTKHFGGEWIGGNDLSKSRLDLFYTLICILNFLNLLNYIFWAKRY